MADTVKETPTEVAEVTRTTPRQRRIEEQRAKIETMRHGYQRRRLRWGGLILVAFAAVVAVSVLFLRPPTDPQGHQVPMEGNRQHNPAGTAIQYKNRPPSSGDHYDQPWGYGVVEREVATGSWVHTLEHGGIVILYNCPNNSCPDVVNQLRDVYSSARDSTA